MVTVGGLARSWAISESTFTRSAIKARRWRSSPIKCSRRDGEGARAAVDARSHERHVDAR